MTPGPRTSRETSGFEIPDASYAIEPDAVLARLGADASAGLSIEEASVRLRRFGPNAVETDRPRSVVRMLVGQFTNIVVLLLIAAAAVAFFTGSALEGSAILVVLILNALIGFLIEFQADKALVALRHATQTTARIRRGGREEVIDAVGLVPGDMVVLTAGDRVPADARLIEAVNLRCDESSLTGESVAGSKSAAAVDASTPLADRDSMVYLGTTVVAGRALAVVVATGKDTEIGHIGTKLLSSEEKSTPLERRLAELGRRLVYVVIGIAVIVLAAGLMRGDELWLMAKVAISLAVAAVPEGLPAVTTLILALGVLRMARRNAIVRKLSAVETLGSTTVVCTDKTGTLTENQMTVQEIYLASGRRIVRTDGNEDTDNDILLQRLLRVAVLCSEAVFHAEQGKAIGDPTETALIHAAIDLGVDPANELATHTKVFEIPFDASTKRMTSIFTDGDGRRCALLKGAPSVVLKACSHIAQPDGEPMPLNDEGRNELLGVNEELAGKAFRVLAFADKPAVEIDGQSLENEFVFLGIAGMADPPRQEVAGSIRMAKAAGIRIVMLTGDQTLTAQAIARRLGISDDHDVVALHSSDVSDADTAKLAELARGAHVFARVTPDDKFRIVEALQRSGEIVAVTGDGVNDAPALKQADIGISMGLRGTDVAKEASDIVLTDDNFSTIVKAIEGGRTIYANIVKFVHMMFSNNLSEVLLIFAAIIMNLPLPLMPLQILWVNLVTDVFPALALAVEPATEETMRRRPRSPKETLLSGRMMFLIGWQGAMMAAIALGAYVWSLSTYGEGPHSRTIAMLAIVGVQAGHLFNCRSRIRSAFNGFFANPAIHAAFAAVIALQLLAVHFKPLADTLGLAPLNLSDWGLISLTVVLPVIVVEISKIFARRSVQVSADQTAS